ncbi:MULTISPECIES: hypothetical protein [Burkholderia]|uniref:Membrane protein n=1 Tax=Burkholderia cepacia TaxID=292 RepID=A0AA88Z160_BURCE|nr:MULTISPECIES: hypothetical protein [Burkholderia]KGB92787.1 putative membrane protein [Burkholderia cepacia]KWE55695.1 hypothetical protein WT53_25285 [Burkholderia sp. MSMB2157WGS]
MTAPSSTIPWNIFLTRLQTFLDFGKDVTELIAKSSILLLIVPGLSLWVYLDRIGWHALFLDSISSTSGLLALLIGTLLVVSALLLVLCVPSIFLLFLLSLEKDLHVLSKSTAFVILATVILWMVEVFIGSIVIKHLSVPLLLFATFLSGVAFVLIGWRIDGTSKKFGNWEMVGKAIVLSTLVTVAAISSSSGFLTIESFAGDMSTDDKAYSALAVLLPLSLAGFLPGLMAISMAARSKPATTTIKYAAIGIGFVFYALITWSFTSFSTGIGTRALEKTGVFSVAAQDFELLKLDARPSLERAGIRVTKSEIPLVRAYVRYAFGDIRLLCANEFKPGVTDATEAKGTSDLTQLEQAKQRALDAGRNCVVLKRDDIRPIRLK